MRKFLMLLVGMALAVPVCAQTLRPKGEEDLTPMVFTITQDCSPKCATTLVGRGDFVSDTPEVLKVALEDSGATRVMFNSRGGILRSGLLVGLALREKGIDTALASNMRCYSACAYAFLGGVRRDVREGATLGLHRFYSEGQPTTGEEVQEVSQTLAGYITNMGVKREVMDIASQVSSEEMFLVNTERAVRLGMDNTVRTLGDWSWQLKPQDNGKVFLVGVGQSEHNDRQTIGVVGVFEGKMVVQMGVVEPAFYSEQRSKRELYGPTLQLMVCRYNRTQSLVRDQCVFGEPIGKPTHKHSNEVNGMFVLSPRDIAILSQSQGQEAVEFFLFGGPTGEVIVGNMAIAQKVFASSVKTMDL